MEVEVEVEVEVKVEVEVEEVVVVVGCGTMFCGVPIVFCPERVDFTQVGRLHAECACLRCGLKFPTYDLQILT